MFSLFPVSLSVTFLCPECYLPVLVLVAAFVFEIDLIFKIFLPIDFECTDGQFAFSFFSFFIFIFSISRFSLLFPPSFPKYNVRFPLTKNIKDLTVTFHIRVESRDNKIKCNELKKRTEISSFLPSLSLLKLKYSFRANETIHHRKLDHDWTFSGSFVDFRIWFAKHIKAGE